MGQIKRAKKGPFSEACLSHIALSGSPQSLVRVVLVCGRTGGVGVIEPKDPELQTRTHNLLYDRTPVRWCVRFWQLLSPLPAWKEARSFLDWELGVWGGAVTGTGTGRSMVDAPRSSINIIRRSEKAKGAAVASLPSIVFDHVSQLDDELSLFVLLTALKRVLL